MPSTGEWDTEVSTRRLTPVGAPANGTDVLPVIDWGLPLTACGFEVDGDEVLDPPAMTPPMLEPPPRAGISKSMSAGWEKELSAVSADSGRACRSERSIAMAASAFISASEQSSSAGAVVAVATHGRDGTTDAFEGR